MMDSSTFELLSAEGQPHRRRTLEDWRRLKDQEVSLHLSSAISSMLDPPLPLEMQDIL